jgi:hypothetical protein
MQENPIWRLWFPSLQENPTWRPWFPSVQENPTWRPWFPSVQENPIWWPQLALGLASEAQVGISSTNYLHVYTAQ